MSAKIINTILSLKKILRRHPAAFMRWMTQGSKILPSYHPINRRKSRSSKNEIFETEDLLGRFGFDVERNRNKLVL